MNPQVASKEKAVLEGQVGESHVWDGPLEGFPMASQVVVLVLQV